MDSSPTSQSKATAADLSGLRIDRSDRPSREGGGGARRVALAVLGLAAIVAAAWLVLSRAGLFAPEVVVAKAALRTGGGPSAVLTANGYVVAQRKAAVASKATGRLAELFVEAGSVVKAGDILGRLEHADYDADVAKARAQHEAGLARLVYARRDSVFLQSEFDRQAGLLVGGLTDQSTYDAAKNNRDLVEIGIREGEANARSLRGALDLALANQEYTNIRAPFDATVLRKNAEIGEIVAPISIGGSSSRGAIVDLADMSSLEVEVDVNEAYIARIEIGQTATIRLDAYADRPYAGRVRQIVPTADRQKATVVVKVAFDALDRYVLPEMGAKVTFQAAPGAEGGSGAGGGSGGAGGAVAAPTMRVFIPKAAITERDGRVAALVVEKGRVRAVPLETGETSDGQVEVRSGLHGGELLVISPSPDLKDGARVRTKPGA